MSELLNEISMYLKAEDILNSENMIPIENVKELIDELQQKENIIKEAREYINRELLIKYRQNSELIEILHINKILKILDKGSDEISK